MLQKHILDAQWAYEAGMLDYFLNRLSGVHKARVLVDAQKNIGYLDIETDGLGKHANVTTVALHCDGETRVFVRGVDLAELLPILSRCKLLVTYNGASFDLPFLRRHFQIGLGMPHLDLMYVLRAMGCRGGLKAAEKELGVKRQHSSGIDGQEAIILWKRYIEKHEEDTLRKLMLYNAEDVLVLKELMTIAYIHTMSAYPCRIPWKPHTESTDLMNELFFDKRITPIYRG